MQIHTCTFKYIQELYAPGCAKKCPTRLCPWMYVSVCICKYMKYLCVWVCRYMQIHADTRRYMHIHTYTRRLGYMWQSGSMSLHWDHWHGITSLGPLTCDTRQSLHWGNWHGILLDCALQAGRAGLLRADNVLFSELVWKLEIFGPLLWF